MSSPRVHWLQLAPCAALIFVAGTRLSRYGDVIARHIGLGGGWIGLVLMASVTSLPDLVTGISSVTVADVPDIAVGNVLGACVLNLAMIVVLDALHRHASIYQVASQGHTLGAAFGIVMLGLRRVRPRRPAVRAPSAGVGASAARASATAPRSRAPVAARRGGIRARALRADCAACRRARPLRGG